MLAPAVFFTFAGNILFTYVLPGLPAFALLVAQAWESVGNTGRWQKALAWHALIVPVGVALAVAFAIPRLAHDRSHRDLVRQVESLRTGSDQRLVYLREVTHSAEFYARGRTVTGANVDELRRYLADAPRDFYALKARDLEALPPALRDRLDEIGQYGPYRLLREKQAVGSPP
jgi:4-amino-4-deoxy-L-arabinose transferase-like glycosyltransferase